MKQFIVCLAFGGLLALVLFLGPVHGAEEKPAEKLPADIERLALAHARFAVLTPEPIAVRLILAASG